MDDVPSTEALQSEMQQLAERYARMVAALLHVTLRVLLET